ncbi:hypothetical protein BA768_12185 [Chryseobacterium sp. CBo1]|uniref:hypothetical protein n=1 Tax=Chryseobacterium sp. CBo1 TaxID=1869230 RepID=UPI000810CCFA|nr:hypothetical protein [Chryseobacterium sp. CBo1]OCK52346.1 hypothetical protein BA768_12185 [Chryseobacterium sp. CBo1]
MISAKQKLEIEKYLISKNLPLDILLEVKDHFLNQIDNLQIENKESFDAAFENTKEKWSEDLKQAKYYNGKSIALIAKNIKDKAVNKILLKASLSVFIMLLLLFSLSKLIDKNDFSEFLRYAIIIFFSLPGIFVMRYTKLYHLSFKNKKIRLNIYQGYEGLCMYFGFFFPFIYSYYTNTGERILNFFYNSSENFADIIILMITSGTYFFTIFMQVSFIKSVKKIKNSIQDLREL